MKKPILLLLLMLFSTFVFSQYRKQKGNGLYSTGANEIDKGWLFGIGATYMVPYLSTKYQNDTTVVLGNKTELDYKAKPVGKFGLYAEIGKFKMNGKRVINYMDYALAYKWFRGGEDYFLNATSLQNLTLKGSFSDHLLSANFRIGHRYDKNDKIFFVNGLGANLDYHIIKSRSSTTPIPTKDYTNGPSSLLGELHYFFGVGFKTEGRLIIMPIIETPIFTVYPFNHFISTHPYNNTRFRPIMLRIRLMLLSKDSKSCPKVYNPMGIDPNNNKE